MRGRLCVSFSALAVGVVAAFAMNPSHAFAATADVNCQLGADLQAALDAAGDGDTLIIRGTCRGNFTITNKSLTLQGVGGAMLDGNRSGTVLHVLGVRPDCPYFTATQTVTIDDLRITHGQTSADGGGILVVGAPADQMPCNVVVNVVRSSVLDNTAGGSGGGIATYAARVVLTNSRVRGNSATNGGGATSAFDRPMQIDGSTITDNSATNVGGGVWVPVGGSLRVNNSAIATNSAANAGGGLQLDAPYLSEQVIIRNSVIARNRAVTGAGINDDIKSLILIDSTLARNQASGSGGGLNCVCGFGLEVEGSTFSANSARTGGAAYVTGFLTSFSDSTFDSNTAIATGGALVNGADDAALTNSTFTNNRSLNGHGGAVANLGNCSLTCFAGLSISSSSFDGNKAANGWGGAIYNADTPLTLINTTIGATQSNKAAYGGGLANDGVLGSTTASLLPGTSISGNVATVTGGGIFNTNGGTVVIDAAAIVSGNRPNDCTGC
jgi:polymorphic membrane protein